MPRLLSTLLIAALLSACASKPDEAPERTEAEQYREARESMESNNYVTAVDRLKELEARFPYGRYAEQAQLELIYAQFRLQDYPQTVVAAQRFMRSYPAHPRLDYALYMRGLASYNLDIGLAARYFPIDVAARDPGEQLQSFRDFSELLNRYPDSQYVADARQRMIAVRNRMAELELYAARYYVKRQAYVAANNRARYIIENYPTATVTEEALIILAETFRFLELKKGSQDAIAMLRTNFPESEAFNDAGEFEVDLLEGENRSLTNVVTFGLMGDE